MSVKSLILQHAKQLKKAEMFATKELSRMAKRASLDKALSQLVKEGLLERLARGVFRLASPDNPKPALFDVIKFKAAVFGRNVVTHGLDALKKLKLCKQGNVQVRVATDSQSSSFRALGVQVYLVGITKNRVRAADGKGGLLVRAMSELRKSIVKESIIRDVFIDFGPKDILELNERLPPLMTCWMSDLIFHRGIDLRKNSQLAVS